MTGFIYSAESPVLNAKDTDEFRGAVCAGSLRRSRARALHVRRVSDLRTG